MWLSSNLRKGNVQKSELQRLLKAGKMDPEQWPPGEGDRVRVCSAGGGASVAARGRRVWTAGLARRQSAGTSSDVSHLAIHKGFCG